MIYYKKQEHGYWQEIQISEVEDSKLSFTYIIKPLSFQVPCGIPNAKYCWHAEGHPSLHQGTRMLLTFGQTWKHCTTNWDQVHSWSTGAYKHSGPQASGLRTQCSNHVWIRSLWPFGSSMEYPNLLLDHNSIMKDLLGNKVCRCHLIIVMLSW